MSYRRRNIMPVGLLLSSKADERYKLSGSAKIVRIECVPLLAIKERWNEFIACEGEV